MVYSCGKAENGYYQRLGFMVEITGVPKMVSSVQVDVEWRITRNLVVVKLPVVH